MSERDEEAYPMADLEERLDHFFHGQTGVRVQFKDRAGRSEKITIVIDDHPCITVSATTRKPGESRRALVRFLESCVEAARKGT